MRAAFVEELGSVDKLQLGDQPMPEPAAGEVRIKVHAASVGPWDSKMIAGLFGQMPTPLIPGLEAAGVVDAAGEGATFQPGDKVFGSLGFRAGGLAEYAIAASDRITHKPDVLSWEEATALVVSAGTSYEGLIDRAQLQSGETVLILGAAGGVGTAAVQIAVAQGARVLAVAGAQNHAYLRSLGAAATFDYHDAGWVAQVRAAAPDGVDVLFDGAGGATRDQAVATVRPGGRAVFIVGPPANVPDGITPISFSANVNATRLEAISHLVQAGKLKVTLEEVLPLDQARQALERAASGHTRGKIVVQIAS